MFRFADKGTVFWPVELPQNSEDGQEVEVVTVYFGYRLLSRKQLREREKRGLAAAAGRLVEGGGVPTVEDLMAAFDAATARTEGDAELLLEHVTGWRGIADGETAVEFSPERLSALLEFDVYFKPIMAGLHEASRSAPAKNSQPGSAGTPARVQA